MAQRSNQSPSCSSSFEQERKEEFIKNIEKGNNNLIRRVLDENPRYVNAVSRTKKTTALITAIKIQNIEIIKLLIDCNANVEECGGRFPESPLFYAIATKNPTILELLLAKCDVNKKIGERQFTPLHEAVDRRNNVAVSMLLNHPHINPNIQDQNLSTPLHIAVSNDSTEIVNILLERAGRIDLTIRNQDGFTADMVNTGGSACKIVEEFKKRPPQSTHIPSSSSSGREPTESDNILTDEPIIAQPESNPPTPCELQTDPLPSFFNPTHISESPIIPFPSVEVQNEPDFVDGIDPGNAGAQDGLNSMNESSLPPDVVSPGCCQSPKEGPSNEPFDEEYSRAGREFVLNPRSDMGSIPTGSMEHDDRRVALPNNQQNTSISTDEVLESVDQIDCTLQKVNMSKPTSIREATAVVNRGPTIEDLKHHHIEKLANKLDTDSEIGNYRELGHAIFPNNVDVRNNINRLDNAYHGGGSPANAFIDFIKTEGRTPCDLCIVAGELKRHDITDILQKSDDIDDFDMLPQSVLWRITCLLDVNTPGVSNWKDFALKFGCTDVEINAFANARSENFVYSPTEALVRIIKNGLPGYKLADLRTILKNMKRNDVVFVLDGITSEL